MDDGGRCLLDVIDDPMLLESFLDDDSNSSSNTQSNDMNLDDKKYFETKENVNFIDTSVRYDSDNKNKFIEKFSNGLPVTGNNARKSVKYNSNVSSVAETYNNVTSTSVNARGFGNDGVNQSSSNLVHDSTNLQQSSLPVNPSIPQAVPLKSPARPCGQSTVPTSQTNAPSPSLFNSPSPAVATSVMSPAVPSPSQSAAITTLPCSQTPNVVTQIPAASLAPVQIAAPNSSSTPQANVGQPQLFQIITPVAQPRMQAAIRPKPLQILPKPPISAANQYSNSNVTKAAPAAPRMVAPPQQGNTQPQLLFSQPQNAILPPHAAGQGGMILLNTVNQGPILIPASMAGLIPGLQLAIRPAVQHTSQQAPNVTQSQLITPFQVPTHPAAGQSKNATANPPTFVIPANAMPGRFPNGNIAIMNNHTNHATSLPSNQCNVMKSQPPSGVVLGPRIVNGSNPGMLQQVQTPHGPMTVSLQPNQVLVNNQHQQNVIQPVHNKQSNHDIFPATSNSVEKPKKSQRVDLAELLKEHGIATDDELMCSSTPQQISEPEPIKSLPQQIQQSNPQFYLSLAQDGSIQLQPSSISNVQNRSSVLSSSSSPFASLSSSVSTSLSSSVPVSSAALPQTHSVLLERLNSAPVNGVTNQSPSFVPLSVQQMSTLSQPITSSPTYTSSSRTNSTVKFSTHDPNVSNNNIYMTRTSVPVIPSQVEESQKVQTIQLSLPNQQLLQKVQGQISHLASQKTLSTPQKGVLQHLLSAQQKILIDGKNAFDSQQVEESVQSSSNVTQNAYNKSQAASSVRTLQNQNVHLTNLLKQSPNNINPSSPSSSMQTVIQPQLVLNSSFANNNPIVSSNDIASTNNGTSSIVSSAVGNLVPNNNNGNNMKMQMGQQLITIAPQQNHNVTQMQPTFRGPLTDQQKLACNQKNQPLLFKLQQPNNTGSVTLPNNIPPGTVFQLQPVTKGVQPVLSTYTTTTVNAVPAAVTTATTTLKENNRNKLNRTAGNKRPPINKSLIFQQNLTAQQKRALNPEIKTPFKSKADVVNRLLPYHVLNHNSKSVSELADMDRLFDVVSQGLMEKMRMMMNKYQYLLLKDSMKDVSSIEMVMLGRMFVQEETASLQADKKTVSDGEELHLPPLPKSWLTDETTLNSSVEPSSPCASISSDKDNDASRDHTDNSNGSTDGDNNKNYNESSAEDQRNLDGRGDGVHKKSFNDEDIMSKFLDNELELYDDSVAYGADSSENFHSNENYCSNNRVDFEPPVKRIKHPSNDGRTSPDDETNADKSPKQNSSDVMFSPQSEDSNNNDDCVDTSHLRRDSNKYVNERDAVLNAQVESAINSILDFNAVSDGESNKSIDGEYVDDGNEYVQTTYGGDYSAEDCGDNADDTLLEDQPVDDLDEAIRSILM